MIPLFDIQFLGHIVQIDGQNFADALLLHIVVAKSAKLRFRLAAKTALTPLLLLSPQHHAILRGPLMAIPVYFAIGAIC